LAVVSALVAALLPKCPLCVAAYLSVFGVTVGAAGVALVVLRPLALALCATALGFAFLRAAVNARESRRHERSQRAGCATALPTTAARANRSIS
jgi:hypothetical protein